MHVEFYILKEKLKNFTEFIWFWGRCRNIIDVKLDPCSTLEHQTWSNDQSRNDLLHGGVSLSINLNLKLAPVPYATPKWPIYDQPVLILQCEL